MNNRKGYVYVMMNPSYDGIVKIGKTTKEPEERAKELSSATGVATPFIVVYKRLFNNCDMAEHLVHDILSEKGYRVNDSREFFSLSVTEAVNTILGIPDESYSVNTFNNIDDDNYTAENLADIYYEKAVKYELGSDNVFQDNDKAIFYYEKSAELGKVDAYRRIGGIWLRDKLNTKEAMDWFHKGAVKGCYCCYAELGFIYGDKESRFYNERNTELAFKKFFEFVDENPQMIEIDYKIGIYIRMLVDDLIINGELKVSFLEAFILRNLEFIYNIYRESIVRLESNIDESSVNPRVLDMYKKIVIPCLERLGESHII